MHGVLPRCAAAQEGDFVVHLAGIKGAAKCLTFRRYYIRSMRLLGAPTAGDAAVPSLWRCLSQAAAAPREVGTVWPAAGRGRSAAGDDAFA